MKNAIWYKDSWLMPNSTALELYKEWKKDNADKVKRKKFEDHMKVVNENYKKMCGISSMVEQ